VTQVGPGDINRVARGIRPEDEREIRCACNLDPEPGLAMAVAGSDMAFVIRYDNDPVALFGIARSPCGGTPWLLGTPKVALAGRAILREAPKWIEGFRRDYRRLTNAVLESNTLHRRWLTALDADWYPDIQRNGETLIPFEL
jgi:hypothetical protein